MCSIVSQPYPSLLHSPRSASFGSNSGPAAGVSGSGPAHIIYKDDKVTAYLEKNNPVSSKGHVVIMLKCVASCTEDLNCGPILAKGSSG